MAAKLIDLSFTLNGRKVKVQIAPDTMLFALLREQGCASVRCACETTNCGLCTVWLDGDPVLSCSVPAPVLRPYHHHTRGSQGRV